MQHSPPDQGSQPDISAPCCGPAATCDAPASTGLPAMPEHAVPLQAQCVAVAVSGGADSLYALTQMRQQARKVIALHGLFLPTPPSAPAQPAPQKSSAQQSGALQSPQQHHSSPPDTGAQQAGPPPGLREACEHLGVELHVLDMRAAFDTAVIAPFMQAYLTGHTPNPCAHCNAHIKFGALWDAARSLGADALSTGHYAALVPHPVYGLSLQQGQDMRKDQSYFLSLVPMQALRHAIFPLASQHKSEAIAFLHEQGLTIPLPKESQDICFIPSSLDKGYRTFMYAQAAQRGLSLGTSGPMCLPDGRIVGEHQGLWQYTQGQRKGLGVAYSEPLYVTGKDSRTNTLLLGTKEDCLMRGCTTAPANLLVAPTLWPAELMVRVRYRQTNAPATVEVRADGSLRIQFAEVQSLSATGQIATVYDTAGCVLAGAVINTVY